MEYRHILTETRGKAFILTFNRDETRNAVNRRMGEEIRDAMQKFEEDDGLWVAVVTHRGSCFCSGSDLKDKQAEWAAGRHDHSQDPANEWGFASLTRRVFSKPTIAAVNGKVLGGGMEIVLAMDMVVASENSVFGLPEPAVGLMAAAGGLLHVVRQMPYKIAMELICTGDPIPASLAREYGLVNRLVPGDQVLPAALELAGRICKNAPLAVRHSKTIALRGLDSTVNYPPAGWDIMRHYNEINDATEDAKEGMRAFTEKRPPVWKGK